MVLSSCAGCDGGDRNYFLFPTAQKERQIIISNQVAGLTQGALKKFQRTLRLAYSTSFAHLSVHQSITETTPVELIALQQST